jgi:hypothetical protein
MVRLLVVHRDEQVLRARHCRREQQQEDRGGSLEQHVES